MKTKKLTMIAMLTALVILLTAYVKIPLPNGEYKHLGDMAIFVAAIIAGPWAGLFVGGVGSAIADALAGAPQWILATLITKSLMGLTTGLLASRKGRLFCARNFLAMLAGGLVMVAGYHVAYGIMLYDFDFIKPFFTIWTDFAQFGVGLVFGGMVLFALDRSHKKFWE